MVKGRARIQTKETNQIYELNVLEVHRAIAHTRGRGDGRQGRGECCDDDAQRDLNQARSNLLRTVHPSAATLVAYYNLLVALHPDRNATDSAPLYQEYIKILLNAYSNTQQFTTSWWQMKSILERHYHAVRWKRCFWQVSFATKIMVQSAIRFKSFSYLCKKI